MLEVRSPDKHDLMAESYIEAARKGLLVSQHHCEGRPEVFENAVRSIEVQLGVRITGATLGDLSQVEVEPGADAIKVGFFQTMDVPQKLFGRMPWTILGRPGFLISELNQLGFSYILPLTRKFAVATHLELGGKDRAFVDASTKMVAMVNAEVWGRAPRYRFAPREDFTGRDVISGLERLNDFLSTEAAALSEDAQHVARQIPHELSHSSVEDAEKAAAEILQAPSWRFDSTAVQEVIHFIDRLIANTSWLPPMWADSLPWWRRKVAFFAEDVKNRPAQRGRDGDATHQ